MFDTLTDKLHSTFKNLTGDSKLSAENIEDAIREVRKSLLEADVSLKVVKLFISNVRQKALGAEVLESVTPTQQFIKIVYDELVVIFGGENVPLQTEGTPGIIMLLGLQGAGKTTATAKLANKLKHEGMKPLMVACDVQRPAAIKQLQTLGEQIDVPVFTIPDSKDVQDIAEQAIKKAKEEKLSPVLLDTAGRLQVDTELMAELLLLDRALEPAEKILVVDAMTGQEAVNVAETFNTQLDITGVLLAKSDGDARGGAALSVRESVGKPIKLISTGEKMEDLEAFYPDRMASRILDMGDVLSLMEKAQKNIDEKEAERLAKEMMGGDFTLDTFMQMQKMMKKMGPMGDIMKMMGMGNMFGINSSQQKMLADEGEVMMKLYETAINSMTKAERKNPDIIDFKRRRRISKGSGLKDNQLGQMLNQFQMMRQMFNMMRPMMGGMMGGGGGMPGMGGMGMPDLGSLLKGGGMPKMPPMPPGMKPGQMPPGFPPLPPMGGGGGVGAGAGKKFKKRRR
ncbi:MAG: signal recognition particle protein [Candidatus Melainabacteria bacterium]|nr:signal recognition particle protein [Candidatus Melainabacteria bacterium]